MPANGFRISEIRKKMFSYIFVEDGQKRLINIMSEYFGGYEQEKVG